MPDVLLPSSADLPRVPEAISLPRVPAKTRYGRRGFVSVHGRGDSEATFGHHPTGGQESSPAGSRLHTAIPHRRSAACLTVGWIEAIPLVSPQRQSPPAWN